MTEVVEMLRKQFNAFTAKIDMFDGTSCVIDFISDVKMYCHWLDKVDNDDKLSVLFSHLTGEAKDVFRLIKEPTFDSVIEALKIRFEPTEQMRHQIKADLFGSIQMSGESYKQFVIRLQNKARHIEILESDLVKIAINGATHKLKQHLLMASPKTMECLLQIPLVANTSLQEDEHYPISF